MGPADSLSKERPGCTQVRSADFLEREAYIRWFEVLHVSCGSIASILTCPRYVRLAGNSGNVDWLLNGSTLGVIHLVYAPTSIRIRHPSCSPTVARRPADRERSPTAGFPPLA